MSQVSYRAKQCIVAVISMTNVLFVTPFVALPNAVQLATLKPIPRYEIVPSLQSSPLEDEPWRKDESYWDMMQQASKDPETWEKFVEEGMAKNISNRNNHRATAVEAGSKEKDDRGSDKNKKGRYQPIEEWDAERKSSDNMSAEERLQWECQRQGNQFRQNEILSQNLISF